jgi:hypothetical protein
LKIISGGQTGVDRAALDVALKHGIECGGWCPAGRLDEFGKIPGKYPLTELPDGNFDKRTLQNVRDSEATVAMYDVDLRGGTKYAIECCEQLKRPYLLIDAATISPEEAAKLIVDLVHKHKIHILGVGGPRASEWPGGYDYAFRALEKFLTRSVTP